MFKSKNFKQLFIAAIIIAIIVWLAGEDIYFAFNRLSLPLIFLLISLQIFTLLLIGLQWWYIFLADSDKKISYSNIIKINLASKFVESVTPASKLGGESAKIYMFRKITDIKTGNILAAAAVQKSTTFLGFFILIIPFISYWPFQLNLWEDILANNLPVTNNIFLIFILLGAVFAVIWYIHKHYGKRIYHKFKNIKQEFIGSLSRLANFRHIGILTFISFAYWLLYPVKVYILANYIFGGVDLTTAAAATFIAYFVSMIPLTPGGLGGFEATMALILSQNGLSWQAGLSIAFLLRIFTFWLPLLVSAVMAVNISSEILPGRREPNSTNN